jgi:hypothetical protein
VGRRGAKGEVNLPNDVLHAILAAASVVIATTAGALGASARLTGVHFPPFVA